MAEEDKKSSMFLTIVLVIAFAALVGAQWMTWNHLDVVSGQIQDGLEAASTERATLAHEMRTRERNIMDQIQAHNRAGRAAPAAAAAPEATAQAAAAP